MEFLVIIPVLGVSGWLVLTTYKRLRQRGADRKWWYAFCGCTVIGVVLGCMCAFCVDYHVSPKMRFFSFPLPLAVFQLENGVWVDFVHSGFVMWSGVLANIAAITAFIDLPIFFISLRVARMRASETAHP